MLVAEAKWIRFALSEVPHDQLFPLLNVGSQDWSFRAYLQPWIEEQVFEPLRSRHGRVVHLDLIAGEGVDVAGDLCDVGTRDSLNDVRSVLCSNVLEHVPDRHAFAAGLASLVRPGAYLILTCPFVFPYHPDPIDTMFRPGIEELRSLFPEFEMVEGEVVRSTMAAYVCGRIWAMVRYGRKAAPTQSSGGGAPPLVSWLWRRIAATCLLLRKPDV